VVALVSASLYFVMKLVIEPLSYRGRLSSTLAWSAKSLLGFENMYVSNVG
jgi:hypothetical protein